MPKVGSIQVLYTCSVVQLALPWCGAGCTIFVVPGDARAWQIAKPFGDSAVKSKGADMAARGAIIFVVPRRGQ